MKDIVKQYSSIERFREALNSSYLKQLFTHIKSSANEIFLELAFLSQRDFSTHRLELKLEEPKEKHMIKAVKEFMQYSPRRVDGKIEQSPFTGNTYLVFETETPEDPRAFIATFQAWLDAVKDLPAAPTSLHYALKAAVRKRKTHNIFDAVFSPGQNQSIHLLTFLESEEQKIASARTIHDLAYLQLINHTPYLDHKITTKEIESPSYRWFADLPS